MVVQQRLLPKVCGKAQGLSSQWKGGLHTDALLLLEQFTQRGSCMEQLSADCSQSELGISQSAWEHSYSCSPSSMTAFTTEGEEEVLQQIKLVFWSITNDWSSSPWAEDSPRPPWVTVTHKQHMWYLTVTTFIDPWCTAASSISMQISGFLLF